MIKFNDYWLIAASPDMVHFKYEGNYYRIERLRDDEYRLCSVAEDGRYINNILEFNYKCLIDECRKNKQDRSYIELMIYGFINYGFILEQPRQFYSNASFINRVFFVRVFGCSHRFTTYGENKYDPFGNLIKNITKACRNARCNSVTQQMFELYILTMLQNTWGFYFSESNADKLESMIFELELELNFSLRGRKSN